MRVARHLAGLSVLLVILAVGFPARSVAPASAAPEHEYIALGDSIAAGLVTSLPRARSYPALVTEQLDKLAGAQPGAVRLTNLAVPGETAESFVTNGQLQRFNDAISATRSRGSDLQLVTVTLGGNDLLQLRNLGTPERQAGLDQFRSSYPAAIAAIRQALGDLKPVIVVTTYYDLSGGDPAQRDTDAWWVAQFNDVVRTTAQADGLKVADVEPAFRGHIGEWTWFPLDVHPNNAGHAEIARLVWVAAGLDQQPPAVTIVKPGTGALSRSIPTVSASVTDNVAVTGVDLWVNGQFVSSLIYEPSLQHYIGVWDSTNVTGTQATLSVHATDLAGHTTTADVTVTIPAP